LRTSHNDCSTRMCYHYTYTADWTQLFLNLTLNFSYYYRQVIQLFFYFFPFPGKLRKQEYTHGVIFTVIYEPEMVVFITVQMALRVYSYSFDQFFGNTKY